MNSNKNKIKVSKFQRDVIHGYLMSDGYLRNGSLTIDQSEKQAKFVQWLYNELESLRTLSPIKKVTRIHPKTKVTSRSLRFYTRSVLFHHMWYEPTSNSASSHSTCLPSGKAEPWRQAKATNIETTVSAQGTQDEAKGSKGVTKYKKRLPKSIDCFFNETFITVWFAGDGTKVMGSAGAKFEVTRFTVEERLKLKSLFFTKFGIKTEIIAAGTSKKGTRQWSLKVPAREYQKFRDLITKMDLIPTIFPYKLHKNS